MVAIWLRVEILESVGFLGSFQQPLWMCSRAVKSVALTVPQMKGAQAPCAATGESGPRVYVLGDS